MAAIANQYTEQTTEQTIASATWTELVSIAAGSLVANAKYLIVGIVRWNGQTAGEKVGIRFVRGSTVLTGTPTIRRSWQSSSTKYEHTAYVTVDTQPVTAEKYAIEWQRNSGTGTFYADNIQLFAMRLDADLTETSDWWFNENTTVSAHTTSLADRATVGSISAAAADKFLIIAHADFDIQQFDMPHQFVIEHDDGTTPTNIADVTVTPQNPDEQWGELLMIPHQPGAGTHSYTVRTRDTEAGTQTDHDSSRIFVLKLTDTFEDAGYALTAGTYSTSAANTWEEIQAHNPTPSTPGDWLILGYCEGVRDPAGAGFSTHRMRLQIADGDVPGDLTGIEAINECRENGNVLPGFLMDHATYSAQINIDLDGRSDNNAAAYDFRNRAIAAFSMELAAAESTSTAIWGLPWK